MITDCTWDTKSSITKTETFYLHLGNYKDPTNLEADEIKTTFFEDAKRHKTREPETSTAQDYMN